MADLGQFGGSGWTDIDPGQLTEMQNQLLGIFSAGAESLVGGATGLLLTLCTIHVAWAAYQVMWGEAEFLPKMLRAVIKCGIYIALVTQAPALFDMIFEMFIDVGVEAGGNSASASLMKDPGAVPMHVLEIMAPVFVELTGDDGGMIPIDVGNTGTLLMASLLALTIVILSMVMAVQIFVTTLEFYLIAAVGLVFMPFGVLQQTKFLADNFYNAIIAVGAKMMVLSAIVAATKPMIEAMQLSEEYTMNHLFGVLIVMMALTMLYLRGPSLAAGLMSGRSGISGSAAMAGGAVVAAPAAGVVAGTVAGGAGGGVGGAAAGAALGAGGGMKESVGRMQQEMD